MTTDELSTWTPATGSWDSATWARVTCDDLVQWPVGKGPRPNGVGKLEDKHCFENAFRLARQHGWRYCEGIAFEHQKWGAFEIHHAWCINERGFVVETTWPEAGSEYRGKVFALDEVARWRLKARETRAQDATMLLQVPGPRSGDSASLVLVHNERFWEELDRSWKERCES